MENKSFFVCYSGSDRYGNKYTPYKAVVHTADEAIAVINTWKTYGKKDSTNKWEQIKVNAPTEKKIRDLFETGYVTTWEGIRQSQRVTMRTTGCGCYDIVFYPALADTLEEHERIYNEQREAEKKERMRQAEEARKKRIAELNVQRRGWYHVELTIRVYVFARHNDYHEEPTYSCTLIADSGMDAYDKVVKWVKDHPEEIMVRGNQTALETWADADSSGFECTFLGVKTDEGYSVKLWEEWHKNGEI